MGRKPSFRSFSELLFLNLLFAISRLDMLGLSTPSQMLVRHPPGSVNKTNGKLSTRHLNIYCTKSTFPDRLSCQKDFCHWVKVTKILLLQVHSFTSNSWAGTLGNQWRFLLPRNRDRISYIPDKRLNQYKTSHIQTSISKSEINKKWHSTAHHPLGWCRSRVVTFTAIILRGPGLLTKPCDSDDELTDWREHVLLLLLPSRYLAGIQPSWHEPTERTNHHPLLPTNNSSTTSPVRTVISDDSTAL